VRSMKEENIRVEKVVMFVTDMCDVEILPLRYAQGQDDRGSFRGRLG